MPQAKELHRIFDPNTLAPGLYVIGSGAPGYGLAKALADEKIVDYLGERYPTLTEKQMLFRVRAKKGQRKPNPDVGVNEESFLLATDAYDNWPIKWWREAIQNACDSGATVIRCDAVEQADGSWLVSCDDNGSGMDRDTIETRLMKIGGSGKRGVAGSIGGFGIAKNMLLYTWPEWEIRSRDVMIKGSTIRGSDFVEVPAREGTRITVRMPGDKHTDAVFARSYIDRCDLPGVTFYVNGERLKGTLKGRQLVKNETEFQLFFNRGETTSALMVRARGIKFTGSLYLFDVQVDVEIGGQVIVDLLLPSITQLTDNRDGFNTRDSGGYYTKQKITEFAKELTVEGKRALKAKQSLVSHAFRGEGKFQAVEREAQATAAVGAVGASPKVVGERLASYLKTYGEDDAEVTITQRGGVSMPMSSPEAARVMMDSMRGPSAVEAGIKQVIWRPDFYVEQEVPGYKIPRAILEYEATPDGEEKKLVYISPRAARLVSVWADLCRFVMMQLGSTKTFGVGFIFSTDTGAAYLRKDGEDWLLLNPFRDVRHQKTMLVPSNKNDLKHLYASAIHEATHMADGISHHGIEFAYALTRNIATCSDGWKVVRRIERATKLGASPEVGASMGAAKGQPKGKRPAALSPLVKHALATLQRGESRSRAELELRIGAHNATYEDASEAVDAAKAIHDQHREALIEWAKEKMLVEREHGTTLRSMMLAPHHYSDPRLQPLVDNVFGRLVDVDQTYAITDEAARRAYP